MNCKPGDLAVIVFAAKLSQIGRLVEVLHRGEEYGDGAVYWHVRVQGSPVKVAIISANNVHTGRFETRLDCDVPDAWLRPIRDPGDDAIDESAAWLPPVPLPAIEPSLLPEKVGA